MFLLINAHWKVRGIYNWWKFVSKTKLGGARQNNNDALFFLSLYSVKKRKQARKSKQTYYNENGFECLMEEGRQR
jgi:hypothetical protein